MPPNKTKKTKADPFEGIEVVEVEDTPKKRPKPAKTVKPEKVKTKAPPPETVQEAEPVTEAALTAPSEPVTTVENVQVIEIEDVPKKRSKPEKTKKARKDKKKSSPPETTPEAEPVYETVAEPPLAEAIPAEEVNTELETNPDQPETAVPETAEDARAMLFEGMTEQSAIDAWPTPVFPEDTAEDTAADTTDIIPVTPAETEDDVEALAAAGLDAFNDEIEKNFKKVKKPRRKRKTDGKDADAPMFIDMDDTNLPALLAYGSERKPGKRYLSEIISIGKIPFPVYVAVAALLCVGVIVAGVSLFLRVSGLADMEEKKWAATHIIIDNGAAASNSANIIYQDVDFSVEDMSIHLKRMSLDNAAAVFYFSEAFDFTALDIALTDNYGRSYGLDLSYIDDDGTVRFLDNSVRFNALIAGSLGFNLTVTNLATGGETSRDFRFTHAHGLTQSKHYNNLMSLKDPYGNVYGIVQGADFTSTGTTIYFKLDSGTGIRYVPELGGSAFVLSERGRAVKPIRNDVLLTDRYNGKTGRMDYRPVDNLSGTVTFTLSRMFKELPISCEIDGMSLFYNNDPEKYVSFETGGYRIVLERILIYTDDSYQLVFHAEDLGIIADDPDDWSNHKELLLDCELILTLSNGEKTTLSATGGRSKDAGANIFFSVDENPYVEMIKAKRVAGIEISINSALVRLDDIKAEIDLDSGYSGMAVLSDNIKTRFGIVNNNYEDYNVNLLCYEGGGSNLWALLREMWTDENGVTHLATREIAGFVDPYTMRLDENAIIRDYTGGLR